MPQVFSRSPGTPGLLVTDGDGRVVHCHEAVAVWFGYQVSELVGRSVDILVPEALRARHGEYRRRFSSRGRRRPMNSGLAIGGLTKDGRELTLDVALEPFTVASRRFVLAVVEILAPDGDISDEVIRGAGSARLGRLWSELAAGAEDLRAALGAMDQLRRAGAEDRADERGLSALPAARRLVTRTAERLMTLRRAFDDRQDGPPGDPAARWSELVALLRAVVSPDVEISFGPETWGETVPEAGPLLERFCLAAVAAILGSSPSVHHINVNFASQPRSAGPPGLDAGGGAALTIAGDASSSHESVPAGAELTDGLPESLTIVAERLADLGATVRVRGTSSTEAVTAWFPLR